MASCCPAAPGRLIPQPPGRPTSTPSRLRGPHTGRSTVTTTLTAKPAVLDLGGTRASTLAYGTDLPGPLIRADVGDELAITLVNRLTHPTSLHCHGIALRNDMDGATPATPNVEPGGDFTYRFSVPHPGTYWAHPHTGLDADTGLYLPLIVDDPAERGDYDVEWIVVLDDWTDGIGKTPEQIWRDLSGGGSAAHDDMPGMGAMPAMEGVGTSPLLGGDAGDVNYPYYLINGRIPLCSNGVHRHAWATNPAADDQRRVGHRVPGRTDRPLHDGHPHRRISGRPGRRRRGAPGDG